ncbi:uncharacterized protein LOC110988213 [Acanthaster planci]|uniref:Uncharacterized protein LOC110988213 n=1 Tax=Acanthaster planci TaxID=133434 RepID=A0A8B7ZQS0_ACAPL|nr:uncharacterized protein LOC110988213 [Acanthaster planci]
MTFTCFMSSDAYPGIKRSCSIRLSDLKTITTGSPTTQSRELVVITTEVTTSRSPSPSEETDPTVLVPKSTPFPMGTTFIVVMTVTSGAIIIILLVVIVCLVSKKKIKRRVERYNSTSSEIRDQAVNAHEEHDRNDRFANPGASGNGTSVGHIRPTGPSAPLESSLYDDADFSVVHAEQPPPEYAVLDPDITPTHSAASNDYAYAYAAVPRMARLNHGEDVFRDEGNIRQNVEQGQKAFTSQGHGKTNQYYEDVDSSSGAGPFGVAKHSDRDSDNDEDWDTKFVDNILYVASSNDAIINEQKIGSGDVIFKKKVKGKPRLDPF